MRICLISSVHPWVNPRLVKEADLLARHGHDVIVVTKRVDAWSDERDEPLLAAKPWRTERINLLRHDPDGRAAWLRAAVRARLALMAFGATGRLRFAEEAYYRAFPHVLSAAVRCRADLYIAHTQGALPIAAHAARATGAAYAFDCEDLLAEEAADGLAQPALRRAILAIERAYLPGAAYVTATSAAMAAFLEATYGIRPLVVRNVFPLDELKQVAGPAARPPHDTIDLVWMSATIGRGRGLEDAVRALALLPGHVRLTLYGRVLPLFDRELHTLVAELGLGARIAIRPIPEPLAIMPAIARADIGLALDPNDCLNRSLTICNKVFLYLQAGTALAATDTPGQREVVADAPGCGFVYQPGDVSALAAHLMPLVSDRARLLEAQTAAWNAGRQRFNWDVEQRTFLTAVRQAVRPRDRAALELTA